ncbi:MAG: phospholipid methyltransferase [Geminicoccaceae bacterium]|nr:phospholipid methyltransferase [Geminicoccaceae bacterium]
MDRVTLIRLAALYLPLTLTGLIWLWAPPTPRERAAAFLATAWNAAALLALHVLALAGGWWSFGVDEATLTGFPVDLYLGWAVLWGALPALLSRYAPPVLVVLGAVMLDVVAMPQMRPVVLLGDHWLAGEAVAVVLCLGPGLALAEFTRTSGRLGTRAFLQAVAFSALALGVLPQAILEQTGGSWGTLTARPAWLTALLLQGVAALGLLGVSAVQEFATRGGGTPVPFDPPERLVTSGPYAYVRNPMQLSATLVLIGWGALLGSWWVAAAGAMAVIYGAGFAAGDERADLERRFGERWTRYTSLVRSWIPRWRPANVGGLVPSATLYVAEECGSCSEVRAWFIARSPTSLEIRAAEQHPSRTLSRITYDPGDGSGDAEGVAAIARALEHVHLGWALVSMFVRLPGLCQFLQLITDASGGAERQTVRYCDRPSGFTAQARRELR